MWFNGVFVLQMSLKRSYHDFQGQKSSFLRNTGTHSYIMNINHWETVAKQNGLAATKSSNQIKMFLLYSHE